MTPKQVAALVQVRGTLRCISVLAGAAAAEADEEALRCDRVHGDRPYSELIEVALKPFAKVYRHLCDHLKAVADGKVNIEDEDGGVDLRLFTDPDKAS